MSLDVIHLNDAYVSLDKFETRYNKHHHFTATNGWLQPVI